MRATYGRKTEAKHPMPVYWQRQGDIPLYNFYSNSHRHSQLKNHDYSDRNQDGILISQSRPIYRNDRLYTQQDYNSPSCNNINTERPDYRMQSPQLSEYAGTSIENRIKQIEQIMGAENSNLRQQKNFLIRAFRQMKDKQKRSKEQLATLKQRNQRLEDENMIIRSKYQKVRQFIANRTDPVSETVTQQNAQMRCVRCLQSEASLSTNQDANSTVIENLSDKFDVIMFEYQKSNKPELRRQCIQIAGEIKKLKMGHNKVSN